MRFLIGLLLGVIAGIAGTTFFLITAGGGDYFIGASPRVRELEASLKNASTEREFLRKRVGEADEAMARLEARFSSLTARFESLAGAAGSATATTGDARSGRATGIGAAPSGTTAAGAFAQAAPTPTATPGARPTAATVRTDDDEGGSAADAHH